MGAARLWSWILIPLAATALVAAAWLAGDAGAAGLRQSVATPGVGRASVDLGYGRRTRGRLVVTARVRGGRVSAVFTAKGLRLPSLGADRASRLELTVASLCGGRFGATRMITSAAFKPPGPASALPARSVSLPASCRRALPLGVFFRARLVAMAPRTVLHTVSGSIPSLARGADDA